MPCQICGKASGYYPLCKEHFQLRDQGKVVKCGRCGKWCVKNERCSQCSFSANSQQTPWPDEISEKYFVYVIECRTPNHYYVGFTRNLYQRITQHNTGIGSEFTKIHGVKRVVETFYYFTEDDALAAEEKITRQYMKKFGASNVAGGSIAQLSDKARKIARRNEHPVQKAMDTWKKVAKPKPRSQVVFGKRIHTYRRSKSRNKTKQPRTYRSCSTCVHMQACSGRSKSKNNDNDCDNHMHYSTQEGLEIS